MRIGGGDIDAALAVLADAGLKAGPRQDHADFERAAGSAHDGGRRNGRGGCGGAGEKAAAIGVNTGTSHLDTRHGFPPKFGANARELPR